MKPLPPVYPEQNARGNLTKWWNQNGGYSYSYYWDSQERLTKVNNNGTVVEYKYDLLGRRAGKKVGAGNWRWYSYDGLQVLAEGTGQNDKTYYTTNGSAIGGIICRDASGGGGQKLWYHYDRLGNVMAVSDSNGNPYAVYTMEAFGHVIDRGTSTGYQSWHPTDPQPYHLTTKEFDPDAGLYYFNARWYDATTGRFVGRDTEYAVNAYPFCHANPMRYYDNNGREIGFYPPPPDRDHDGFSDYEDPHPDNPLLPVNGKFPYPGVDPQLPYPPLNFSAPGNGPMPNPPACPFMADPHTWFAWYSCRCLGADLGTIVGVGANVCCELMQGFTSQVVYGEDYFMDGPGIVWGGAELNDIRRPAKCCRQWREYQNRR